MSCRVQKVLVVQDATKELSLTSIRWVLNGLCLQPNDMMILLGIIKPLASSAADTSPIPSCWLLSVKQRLDCSSSLNLKQEFVDREIAKKLEEYESHAEIKKIFKLYEMQQIEFQIKVEAGHSLKEIIVQNAKNLWATCIILDRQMKKHEKYFMENLSCGILRLRLNDSMKRIREPRPPEIKAITGGKGCSNTNNHNHPVQRPHTEWYELPETSPTGETSKDKIESYSCSVCNKRRPNFWFLKEFSFSELKLATNSFSPQNLLYTDGKKIFKGQLPNGMQITVKDHSFSNTVKGSKSKGIINEKEFKFEIKRLGKARHNNVAILLGSCSEDGHRLLVYEYVCNDTLDQYLSMKRELPWETRVALAAEAARGLQYLHNNNIYGTNLSPNNILLTHDHKPLLTHYGLARNHYEELDHMLRDTIKRNGYVESEYEDTGKASSKNEVFSFGLVLLELITGRRNVKDTNGQAFFKWARPLLKKKKYDELIDPMVQEAHDIHQLLLMVRVVEKCLHSNPDRRFSIDKVVMALACIDKGHDIEDFSPTESF